MDEIEKSEYPIFCGRVIKVTGIMEVEGEVYTILHYLSPKDEPTEDEVFKYQTSKLRVSLEEDEALGKEVERLKKKFKGGVKRVSIPMRLETAVIEKSEIRTRFGQINLGEDGEGESAKTYEVEVINKNFKYIKILE